MRKQPNRVGGVLESLHPKYPEHLRLIGLITTEWSRLEGAVVFLFWSLLGDPILGSTVFHTLGSPKARADVLRALALARLEGALKKDTLAFSKRVQTIAGQRNDIVHGEWGTPSKGGPDPFVSVLKPATTNPIFQKIYSVVELQDVVDKIVYLSVLANQLWMALEIKFDPKGRGATYQSLRAQNPALDAFLKRYE